MDPEIARVSNASSLKPEFTHERVYKDEEKGLQNLAKVLGGPTKGATSDPKGKWRRWSNVRVLLVGLSIVIGFVILKSTVPELGVRSASTIRLFKRNIDTRSALELEERARHRHHGHKNKVPVAHTKNLDPGLDHRVSWNGLVMKESDADGIVDPLFEGKNGAVTSDVGECSQIGVDLMELGGNAVDAVIGTAICIGTINMAASGVGGGGFAVVRTPRGHSRSFNFREMAPGAATRDMFIKNGTLAKVGGKAFGIPGEVAGFWKLHKKYGRLPWEELWLPSIALCEYGFVVSDFMANAIQMQKDYFEQHREEWAFLFSKATGQLLVAGEWMKRPQYAKTLKAISQKNGLRTFYRGYIAESLVRTARMQRGIITMDDFKRYYSVEGETISTRAFGRKFITCPAPCSGPALIMALNIADGLDLSDAEEPVVVHRMVETMKWMSAGRTNLGDPTDPVYNATLVKEIMSPQYAASVRKNISDYRTYPMEHYRPSFEPNKPKGTSHISALDKEGYAVGLTTTINLAWGNLQHDVHTGIVLNSQMDDFSIPGQPNSYGLYPSIYNFIKPYKRPLSSIVPTIAIDLDKVPSMIVGASGGSRILTGVFECIVKNYRWKYNLLEVIKSPRIHHQLVPDTANVEKKMPEDVIQGLQERGHNVTLVNVTGSAVGAITRAGDGMLYAVADWWRKGALAAAF